MNYAFIQTYGGAANCTNGTFGNAILYAGGYLASGVGSYVYSQPIANCTTTECRAVICAKATTINGTVGSCSTHLYPSSKSIAQTEANEYAFVSTAWGSGSYFWDVGDFNLRPNDLPSVFPNNFTLGNFGDTFNAQTGLYKMIDYIYVHGLGVNVSMSTPFCPSNASDHCMIYGHYTPY